MSKQKLQKEIDKARLRIEDAYQSHPTGYGGSFGEILCYEIHSEPINPRMRSIPMAGGRYTGLTFTELASKWGVSVSFLGELIADHCRKMEEK